VRALLFILVLAGCGDDTTAVSAPDLAIDSCGGASCCPGAPCSAVGSSCSAFETACTCGDDLKYQCHGFPSPADMAHAID